MCWLRCRKTFECLGLAFAAGQRGGLFPAALSAANEEAVSQFLEQKIHFTEIPKVVKLVLKLAETEFAASPTAPISLEVQVWVFQSLFLSSFCFLLLPFASLCCCCRPLLLQEGFLVPPPLEQAAPRFLALLLHLLLLPAAVAGVGLLLQDVLQADAWARQAAKTFKPNPSLPL